ncbi:DUF2975 domain-containing protein [Sporosalibacterium faouarense]|uniref:DUF2975 domain-containing protein n=1 Tax=Sporosalibacterium faouarense TaxID=516123 RepID=UPI00192C5B0B|nr:DUF2975 domain-containing protein [Sporosalibacterium faouarense]
MKVIGEKSISSKLNSILMIIFILITIILAVALFYFLAMTTKIVDFKPHLSLEFGSMVFRFDKNIMPGTALIFSVFSYDLILLFIIYNLRRLFKSFSENDVFITKNVSRIRSIGVSVILMSFVWSIYSYSAAKKVVDVVSLSNHNITLDIVFKLNTTMIFCGIIILVFGEIFKIATKIAEENELTI